MAMTNDRMTALKSRSAQRGSAVCDDDNRNGQGCNMLEQTYHGIRTAPLGGSTNAEGFEPHAPVIGIDAHQPF
jgi:hypothetical protein